MKYPYVYLTYDQLCIIKNNRTNSDTQKMESNPILGQRASPG